jgi:RimJ/RimL family protein N-acetyltransferase
LGGRLLSLQQARLVLQESLFLREKAGIGLWLINISPKDPAIGFCGFGLADNLDDVLLVYGLRAERQDQGFALEAARAVLAYAFEKPAFSRVYAQTETGNCKSRALLLRLGMRPESEISFGERRLLRYVLLKMTFQALRS